MSKSSKHLNPEQGIYLLGDDGPEIIDLTGFTGIIADPSKFKHFVTGYVDGRIEWFVDWWGSMYIPDYEQVRADGMFPYLAAGLIAVLAALVGVLIR